MVGACLRIKPLKAVCAESCGGPVTEWEAQTRRNLPEHDTFVHVLLIVFYKLLRYWTTTLRIVKRSKCTNIILVDSEARSSYGKPTEHCLLNTMNSYAKIIECMNIVNLRFAMFMRFITQIPAKSQPTHGVWGLPIVPTSTITST